jgi:hypothetical protein
MTRPDDLANEMTGHDTAVHDPESPLVDDDTAERLLRGFPVDDAPLPLQRVAEVLSALRDRSVAPDPTREQQGVAAFLAGLDEEHTEPIPIAPRRRARTRRMQLAAAAAVASLTLLGGIAVAGALPGAAQGIARDMLDKVGISVPGPSDAAGAHSDERGHSTDHGSGANASDSSTGSTGSTGDVGTAGAPGDKGNAAANGASTSSAASGGKSQAGEHGNSAGSPPVDTPSTGGSSTADDASNGQSSTGTDTADSHSDGNSSAGSANSDAGRQHNP